MSQETRTINSGSGLVIDGFDDRNTDQFVQSVYPKYDGADFGGAANASTPQQIFNQVTTTNLVSSPFNCAGRARVLFKIEYSNTTAQATLRLWFKDHNVTPFYRPLPTITPSNINTSPSGITPAQAGYSHGISFSVDTEGAKEILVQIASLTNPGTDRISLWACGV